MQCPRDNQALKEVDIDGISVDVCERCGGVWFDNLEMEKFDEQADKSGEKLLAIIAKYQKPAGNPDKRLKSPRHPDVTMMRHYYSPKKQVVIDVCPQSGGVWLDAGELARIRSLYATDEEQQKAGEEFVRDVLNDSEFRKTAEKNRESLAQARRIAKMFKFICPSYYLPGKQDWGAF